MDIKSRSTEYQSKVPGRKVRGVILHSTETKIAVAPHSAGSWHYEIDRDGTVLQYIADEDCAWHVRAPDQRRPSWLVEPPSGWRLSPVNFCTIGIEIVSHSSQRAAGEPYTNAQYTSIQELCQELENRHGGLHYENHGDLQSDRTDPVGFDHARAGFVLQPGGGYLFKSGYLFQPGNPGPIAAESELGGDYMQNQITAIQADRDLNYNKMIRIQARLEQAVSALNRSTVATGDENLRGELNEFYGALLRGEMPE